MITAIVPVYGNCAYLGKCLESLNLQVDQSLVIDDGSGTFQDLHEDPVSSVWFFQKDGNEGFSATCNFGAGSAADRTDWFLFVNSDIELLPGCVNRMREVSTLNTIVGAKLLYPDYTIQHGGVFYDSNTGFFDHRYRFQPNYYVPAGKCERSLVTGALLLMHKSLFWNLRGFSTDFRMAFEDIDLELRALAMGAEVIYQGQAEAIHLEGATRGRTAEEKAQRNPQWQAWEEESSRLFHERYSEETLKRFANREGPYESAG